MKKLFSEQMGQPLPRVKETLDNNVRSALIKLVETRTDDNSFGESFPEMCPDGHGNCGCDRSALKANMDGFNLIWPGDTGRWDHPPVTDAQVFDLLEYTWEHIAEAIPGSFHSYFGHSHHDYDIQLGRSRFADHVNRLFERNGTAYHLTEGQVERLTPSVLQAALVPSQFNTGDDTLNGLLSTAREKFLNRDLQVRREALEKLWDAWERLKSLSDPDNKKNSVRLMLDKTATEPNLRSWIETEA